MNNSKFLKLFRNTVIFLTFISILSCSSQEKTDNSSLLNSLSLDKNQQKTIIQKVYQNREKFKLCDGDINPSIALELSSVYSLDKGQYLVEFLCFMGAYQGNYEYYLYQESKQQFIPLNFEVIDNDKTEQKKTNWVKSIGGLSTYEPSQKLLTILTKYRGLGDCGSLTKYQWKEQKFQLIEFREKENCDGNYVEPEEYSRVYP